MPMAVSIREDVPMKGHRPRNLASTTLLTMAVLINTRKKSCITGSVVEPRGWQYCAVQPWGMAHTTRLPNCLPDPAPQAPAHHANAAPAPGPRRHQQPNRPVQAAMVTPLPASCKALADINIVTKGKV